MQKLKRRAFTLVELIIVIVILAILASIAYLTLKDYPGNARDAVRKTDLKAIAKALEINHIKSGTYPTPDNSGGENNGWEKGKFGDTAYTIIKKLNELPTDPSKGTNYTYEISADKKKFKLIAKLESGKDFVVTGGVSVKSSPEGGFSLQKLTECNNSLRRVATNWIKVEDNIGVYLKNPESYPNANLSTLVSEIRNGAPSNFGIHTTDHGYFQRISTTDGSGIAYHCYFNNSTFW